MAHDLPPSQVETMVDLIARHAGGVEAISQAA